jgi:Holliday junction resolvase RusA-like endonuclease
MNIQFSVNIRTIGKERPRITRSGHAYTPQKTKDYESFIQAQFKKIFPHFKPIETAVLLEINFFYIRSKSNKDPYHTIKPDIDNLIKAICDSLNGLAYVDDKLITGIIAHKEYSSVDSVHIKISSL